MLQKWPSAAVVIGALRVKTVHVRNCAYQWHSRLLAIDFSNNEKKKFQKIEIKSAQKTSATTHRVGGDRKHS